MTINQFIKECASLDSPIGNLANDILRDANFPSGKSEKDILSYLEFQTMVNVDTKRAFDEFLAEYNRVKG